MTVSTGVRRTNKTILVDLGGIFVHPPVNHTLAAGKSRIKLGRILSSSPWMKKEIGQISEDKCFAQIAELYGFQVEDLKDLVRELRETLKYDENMLSLFKEIKQIPGVALYLVSNISEQEYQALRSRWDDSFWDTFDGIFASWMLGVRKPSLSFYRKVLASTRAPPHQTIFIDDQPENVLAAMSLGMCGVVGVENLAQKLKNLTGDPIQRGLAFLKKHAGKHYSTVGGEDVDENYAQLLILETTNNK